MAFVISTLSVSSVVEHSIQSGARRYDASSRLALGQYWPIWTATRPSVSTWGSWFQLQETTGGKAATSLSDHQPSGQVVISQLSVDTHDVFAASTSMTITARGNSESVVNAVLFPRGATPVWTSTCLDSQDVRQ